MKINNYFLIIAKMQRNHDNVHTFNFADETSLTMTELKEPSLNYNSAINHYIHVSNSLWLETCFGADVE